MLLMENGSVLCNLGGKTLCHCAEEDDIMKYCLQLQSAV